jgi:hypothetical protein
VWIKGRNNATNNNLTDSVRGVTKLLFSNSTAAEATFSGGLSSFDSGGFSLASGGDTGFSASGYTYVAWQWKAGGTAVSNTAGSITSSVSANTTAGFSVCTFTAQSSGTATVGHGLGVAPSMIILKSRAIVDAWAVYHISLGNTNYLTLNTTNASIANSVLWNNTSPTSTVFTLGTGFVGNGSEVAYCFAPVAGYSAFGSYTGNGSADGPFVYLGFRPRYILIKKTDTAGNNWFVWDTSRDTYNPEQNYLWPNSSSAEGVDVALDALSNGFKIRVTSANYNGSGGTYIYACFAEVPFKFANSR